MWHRFDTMEQFDVWHAQVKALLGLPRPGRNAATGEVDESAAWTTDYVTPTVTDDGVFVWLPDDSPNVDKGPVPSDEPKVGVGWTVEDGVITPPPPPEIDAEDDVAGDT